MARFTFVDTSGEEWEQPADLVILSAFSLFNAIRDEYLKNPGRLVDA